MWDGSKTENWNEPFASLSFKFFSQNRQYDIRDHLIPRFPWLWTTHSSLVQGESFCQNHALQVLAPFYLQLIHFNLVTHLQPFGLVSNTILLQIYQCQIQIGEQRYTAAFSLCHCFCSITGEMFIWTTSVLESSISASILNWKNNSVQRNCNIFSGFLSAWKTCKALWVHVEVCVT